MATGLTKCIGNELTDERITVNTVVRLKDCFPFLAGIMQSTVLGIAHLVTFYRLPLISYSDCSSNAGYLPILFLNCSMIHSTYVAIGQQAKRQCYDLTWTVSGRLTREEVCICTLSVKSVNSIRKMTFHLGLESNLVAKCFSLSLLTKGYVWPTYMTISPFGFNPTSCVDFCVIVPDSCRRYVMITRI